MPSRHSPEDLMLIHLIRHAHAGSRREWVGDDAARPLSSRGFTQAAAIASELAHEGIDRLWTSPFVRCEQTVKPLAAATGLGIERVDLLAEGADGSGALLKLLAAADEGRTVAACSHGDVIPAIVDLVMGQGAELSGSGNPKKGARYVMQVRGGAVAHVHYVPPTDRRN